MLSPVTPHRDNIASYLYWWNNTFPYDRWWREKYQIPLHSPQHLLACPIAQKMEFEEEILFRQIKEQHLANQDRPMRIMGELFLSSQKSRIFDVDQGLSNDEFDAIDINAIP